MEVWALRPHAILVKVISVCRVHVFFHQYVADLQEERSENVLRTVSASPFIFDMTVSSTSGVITTPPEDLPREVLPLTTEVNILYGVNMGTPFVVPPALDIERPVMQLHDFLTYRTSELRQYSLLLILSASSSAITLPRRPAKFSSSSFSIDRFQPLRGKTSPPTEEALLPPPADDCLAPGLDVSRTLLCSRLGRFSGYLRHCQRDHRPLRMAHFRKTTPSGWLSHQRDQEGRHQYSALCTNTRSPAICGVQVETRHMVCCRFLFSPGSSQNIPDTP